jgi:hypothetical protein
VSLPAIAALADAGAASPASPVAAAASAAPSAAAQPEPAAEPTAAATPYTTKPDDAALPTAEPPPATPNAAEPTHVGGPPQAGTQSGSGTREKVLDRAEKASTPPPMSARPKAPVRLPVPAGPKAHVRPPGRAPATASDRRRHRLAGVVVVAVVLLGAGLGAFALTRHSATASASYRSRVGAAVAIRTRVAAWVAGQVSRSAVVSCDRAMCQALETQGVPAASLLELAPGRTDPLHSSVIVATSTMRQLLGGRLGAVYAPAALADFGSGSTGISVRVIAPHGAAAYSAQLAADVEARKESGSQLLRSQRITVSAAARSQLVGGLVDSRLLVTIAGLAAQEPISIVAFGDLAPGASPGIPTRSADLAETGATASARAVYLQSMLSFLRAQRGDYKAAHIQTLRLRGGQRILRIEFAAPSPLGLLTPTAG